MMRCLDRLFHTSRFARRNNRSTSSRRPTTRLHCELLERRIAPTINEFPLPSPGELAEIKAGPDGNLWFGNFNAIGEISPTTHAVSQVYVSGNEAFRLTPGPGGNIWFTEWSPDNIDKLGKINPSTHALTEIPIPTVGCEPGQITVGPDGNLWFLEWRSNQLAQFILSTHTFNEYPLPAARAGIPSGITVGPDGNLWFTMMSNWVGQFKLSTHAFSFVSLQRTPVGLDPIAEGIIAGPDGNLWFTETNVGNIGVLNPLSLAVTPIAIPTPGSSTFNITAGADGNIWFNEAGPNKIGRVSPTTHAMSEFAVPTPRNGPFLNGPEGITAGPDGNIWFTELSQSKIGQVVLSSLSRPNVSLVNPNAANENSNDTSITVTGSQFAAGATVYFGGASLSTTFVSASQLQATIPSSDLTNAETTNVAVSNPDGSTSNALPFTVLAAPPTIASLSPTTATQGSPAISLTVNGSLFNGGASVKWNGVALATTFVSNGQLRAGIPAADLTQVVTASITVTNPDALTSNSLAFTVLPAPPVLTSLSPSSARQGSGASALTVNGNYFRSGATVKWNREPLTTSFVSGSQLQAAVPASDLTSPGMANVFVVNPDGSTSNAAPFTVLAAPPTITSLSPSTATQGSAAISLTVNGNYFHSGATVIWNGASLTTSFVSTSQLQAAVPASDLTNAGTVNVWVANPDTSTSNTVPFTVLDASPTLSSLSPSTATQGSAAISLTVNGNYFHSGATVRWNGAALATTFVRNTQLQATIPSADLTQVVTASITVTNPDALTSNSFAFSVLPAPPVLSSLSPSQARQGSGAFTLTVSGNNFQSGSTVRWNGAPLATSFVSASQLHAAVPASDLTQVGSITITVLNPPGSVSNGLTFTVLSPAPMISQLSPNQAAENSNDTPLTVTGANFVPGATIDFGLTPLRTTYVSAGQLQATISSSSLTPDGTVNVAVANPDGSTSNTLPFTINAAPIRPSGTSFSVLEGSAADNIVATFTQPGSPDPVSHFSAAINWGNNQLSTGIISYNSTSGVFQVHGSHSYPEEGTQQVTVTIHHGTTPDVSVVSTAHIVDAAVAPAGSLVIYAFTNVNTGQLAVANFTDPGGAEPLADYSASIAWGDGGTSVGTLTFSAGVFSVQGSHTYSQLGTFIITTTIHHDSAADATATAVAHVSVKGGPLTAIPPSGLATGFGPAVAVAVQPISSSMVRNFDPTEDVIHRTVAAAPIDGIAHVQNHYAEIIDRLFGAAPELPSQSSLEFN
jgi:streptogramin lyase